VAEMRTLPKGIDQRSACRHPDWTGPDDLEIKIEELREITDWQKPIYIKVGASRPYYDTALAIKSGADVVVLDGMQGGTAATQSVFIEHVGIPTLAAVRQAVDALEDLNMKDQVQLIVSGGIRTGADVAKALAMGADAVSIGQGVLMALGCNSDSYVRNGTHHSAAREYEKLGTAPGYCHHCQSGLCPVGITTRHQAFASSNWDDGTIPTVSPPARAAPRAAASMTPPCPPVSSVIPLWATNVPMSSAAAQVSGAAIEFPMRLT